MKRVLFLLAAFLLLSSGGLMAQVEDSTMPPTELPDMGDLPDAVPVDDMPAGTETPAPATNDNKPLRAATVRKAPPPDTIKGNAGKDVALLAVKSACGELQGIAITNRSATRILMARVDISVTYRGRMSQKSTLVDNLSPGEVRTLGCTGCVNKSTGKACTRYKIIAAAYK